MEYTVVKVYNNNVVLASQSGRDVIIVSKGIGFGKKMGDTISSSHSIEKVFHEINIADSSVNLNEISKVRTKVEHITRQIILIAESKLGELNQNIEKALVEHIEFALERLEMGLVIENPFIDEIIYLYKEEYVIAEIAGELIQDQLGIDIGTQEKGFIALHLHSARTNRTIGETMKNTRIYKDCLEILEKIYGKDNLLNDVMRKEFFYAVKLMISMTLANRNVKMVLKKEVIQNMAISYKAAKNITSYLEEEMDLAISEDMVAFLAVDVEKIMA